MLGTDGSRRSAYETDVDRWDAELKRLKRLVDPQALPKSSNPSKAAAAAWDAARAAIQRAEADLLSYRATLSRAKVEASVATAALAVAESEETQIEEQAGYLTLNAPYDGLIVARNASTLDFVQTPTGDTTAMKGAPRTPHRGATPIYVVDRIDVVRVFVEIPEQGASYVHVGTEASVRVKACEDEPIRASVTHIPRASNVKRRVLRAEIDLPNPEGRLKPGMYAYAEVIIERPGVQALPMAAGTSSGDKTYCWTYENGRAVRTEIERASATASGSRSIAASRPPGRRPPVMPAGRRSTVQSR